MAVIEVDEENFQIEIERAFLKKDIVIVKFGSEYCEPCHALECELEELEEELKNLSILMVDTDESPSLAEQFGIYQLPTMVIYRDRDTIIRTIEGVMLAPDIQEIIQS
ncbi:thioredoxin family protein [Sulfurovum sp. bin170]|uniref:thioredoxin family protein n=1 Tax=Sulfurovum sp. bin170 TaxID=2695268 RepID=UPI0013DEF06F|nr:thioredoxin family protein [Sulfurovum sp. bin170]NEW60353.1 thioredoxin family protein [Sulfurovum sp. bin170]